MPSDACEVARLRCVSSFPISTKFPVVQADRGRPLESRYIAVLLSIFQEPVRAGFAECLYTEILVAVVERETQIANFRQVTPLCVINLMS